jgi:D-alanyl-lipoteichoic acid acyltransferase DltB (MBOAT superfamily)
MLFNSIEFAVFLPVVFAVYWCIGSERIQRQNLFLLCASYFFYGWWDCSFLLLILASSLVDYAVALGLVRSTSSRARGALLGVSLSMNLGLLGFFKYANFFIDNFNQAFTFLGSPLSLSSLSIVLPVGISFYTFQTLSYSIDVYRKKIEPTRDLISFLAFVSFFPQLVAGPIERASNLLPQFLTRRRFEYYSAINGMRQILLGLFKKIVIADNCAVYVNEVFAHYGSCSGSTLALAIFLFAFQIYGDFSGYSDIAIGSARLFGFTLMRNFAYPYFSRDIAEFWRRWHISLSTWFRDYLYIPLGGSVGSHALRNIFIIFLVSGFWHGANWTFIVWGAIHALYFIPLFIRGKNRRHTEPIAAHRWFPSGSECWGMMSTFVLTSFAWVFFRAESVRDALLYIKGIFSPSLFSLPQDSARAHLSVLLGTIFFLLLAEWLQRFREHAFDIRGYKIGRPVRWTCYYIILFLIARYSGEQQMFIYFQF